MILFSTLSQGWQAWLFCYLGLLSGLLFFATMFFANLLTKKGKLKTIPPKISQKNQYSPKSHTYSCNLSTREENNARIIQKNASNSQKTDKKSEKKKRINIFHFFKLKKKKNSENIQIIDKKEDKKSKSSKKKEKVNKINKKRVKNENKKQKRVLLKKKLCTIFVFLWKFIINFATEIIAIFILGAVVVASLAINLKYNYGSLPPVCIILWILSFLSAKFFLKSLAKFFLSIYNKYIKQKKTNNATL